MGDASLEAYHKYAPRWFKVIQWRRIGKKFGTFFALTGTLASWIYLWNTSLQPRRDAFYLYIQQPQTEEERMKIKRQHLTEGFRRNWDINHYEYGQPPTYDMWERRRKYPEYYAGRYEGDGPRYGEHVQKK